MKLLFVGDVMGRAGREALESHLPAVKARHAPDFTIVNGENSANGSGITLKIAQEFFALGVDVITTGNHAWGQREMLAQMNNEPRILRPYNYPKGTPGAGLRVFSVPGTGLKIAVINMMGRVYMDPLDDPFQAMDTILAQYQIGRNVDAIFLDFHAEATSEKVALGHYCDGRITALVGTHTHIPTADTHILPKGTAYQTDAGMTGCYDSVIGVEKEIAIHRFVKKTPGERKRPARGLGMLCGCVIDINDATGLAQSIAPIRAGAILTET